MLQQTRVEVVRDHYLRFIAALPDPAALAAAGEEQYLKLWEGLGYYSRVRSLHKAACRVMEVFGGRIPSGIAELRSLEGVGPYTAAAIASIAFGAETPAVDGNLLRIFARLTAYADNIRTPAAGKSAEAYYLQLMKASDQLAGGDCNQALMDLGACVCVPNARPKCAQCPFAAVCMAHLSGREEEYPREPGRKARRIEDRTVFVIQTDGRTLLHKRPARGLLAGMYELPNTAGHLAGTQAAAYVRSLGFEPVRMRGLGEAKHVFTHLEWHMTGYAVFVDEACTDTLQLPPDLLLADSAEIRDRYSIPSAFSYFTAYDNIKKPG
jgi:A/G-specific adenine glycosylase